MRTLTTAIAGTAALATLVLGAAPPALADVVADTITVTCTGPVTFYGAVGASYQIEFGPDCDTGGSTDDGVVNSRSQDFSADEAGFFTTPDNADSGGETWYAYAYTSPVVTTLLDTSLDGRAVLTAGTTVAWTMGPGWPTGTYPIIWGGVTPFTPSAAGPDLTPWLLAYARDGRDSSCDSGWSPSWAQWPNDGRGGWVCERVSLRYSS